MDRVGVSSETIASVGYDSDSSTLEIEFVSGAIYQYYGVPHTVYEELMGAESHGRYFVGNIRNDFRYMRL
jgi:KTSC domain-containing protein